MPTSSRSRYPVITSPQAFPSNTLIRLRFKMVGSSKIVRSRMVPFPPLWSLPSSASFGQQDGNFRKLEGFAELCRFVRYCTVPSLRATMNSLTCCRSFCCGCLARGARERLKILEQFLADFPAFAPVFLAASVAQCRPCITASLVVSA